MKLFLVVRGDLSPGARAAQLCHAMREFIEHHPEIDEEWYRVSNTVVLLEVEDESRLRSLAEDATKVGAPVTLFAEPDLDNQYTALALGPSGRNLVRRLPLAFRTP